MLPEKFGDRNIRIIGLGYVGLTLAVAMAEAGFQVHGIEINPEILQALGEGRAHFAEYGLNDRLAAQLEKGRFTFSTAMADAPEASVFIVTVGTPIDRNKKTNSAALETVTNDIAAAMKPGDLIILRSTVKVGTTNSFVRPILEASGKLFDLAFCPERTLEGRALAELVSLPQIVGGISEHATFRASQLFSMLTPTIIRVRNAETAELVKLVNNTQRDLMFAFANEVAALCDATGVSAHEVIASGNIGYARANLPMPGPVGGPCLEKDPYILAEGLQPLGFVPEIALAGRRWNEDLPERAIGQVADAYARAGGGMPARIAILGLAFKGRPETDDLRGTMAIPVIAALRGRFPNAEIIGWDAEVSADKVAMLGIIASESPLEAAREASLVIMQNNHPALEKLKLSDLAAVMKAPGMIYDFWNQHARLEDHNLAPDIRYAALGALNARK